jgi:hypothetical protein
MVDEIRLFEVPTVNVPAFTGAFQDDPPWQHLSY